MGLFPFRTSPSGVIAQAFPTGDKTGAGDAATLTAAVGGLPATGGTVIMAPGQWYLKPPGLTVSLGNTQTVVIDGQWGAFVNTVAGAAGDVIRIFNPNVQSGGAGGNIFSLRSGIRGVIIDGTSATAGSTGLHIGDLMNAQVDIIAQNFSGAGSTGLHLDNTVSWLEQPDIRAALLNCTSHVVFEVTTGWDSFSYGNWDFTIQAQANQDGVVLKNGPLLYASKFRVRGNFLSSGSAVSNAVLRLTGTAPVGSPSAGSASQVQGSSLHVGVESNGAGVNTAQTINIGSSTFIENCTGVLEFLPAPNAFAPSNFNPGSSGNAFQFQGFNGIIGGDATLNPGCSTGSSHVVSGPQVGIVTAPALSAGTIFPAMAQGDYVGTFTLSGNTTVSLSGGGHQAGGQRKTIVLKQAAAGGPFTVTWPHNGSPTLSSPTLLWAGGSAPVMTAAANAVDVYDLSTLDGVTWYGRVTANVS